MKKKACFFFILQFFAHVFAVQFPSIESQFPVEEFAAEETLTGRRLIELSLNYSLCPPDSERGQKALKKFDELEKAVSQKSVLALNEDERAEKVLSLIYEYALDHYDIKHTSIDDALLDGVYNCVAASVLFAACAKSAGLNVIYYKTPDHAFCTVIKKGGKKIDVETTNPNGYNPGVRKTIDSKNGKKYLVVNKNQYANRIEVSDKVLAGLIAGNICSDCIRKNDYFKAIPLGASRIAMAGDEFFAKGGNFPRSEFDVLCRNYINSFQTKGDFKNGILFADSVVERWGMTDYFQKYYDSLILNASIDSANKNQFEISVSYFDDLKKNLSKLGYSKKSEMQEYCWLRKIDPVVRKKDFLEAVKMIDEALIEVPSSTKLPPVRKQCLQNYDIEVHNKCVPLFNKRKFEEAKKILQEGLKNHPESTLLKKDLKLCSE